MKKIFFLLLFLTTSVYAQGTVSSMPEETTPVGADLLYLVKNPGGAGTSRKVTVTNLTKGLTAASDTLQGVVTTGTQTFAGVKTFSSNILFTPDATHNIGASGANRPNNIYAGVLWSGSHRLDTAGGNGLFTVSGYPVLRDFGGTNRFSIQDGVANPIRIIGKATVGASNYFTGGGTAQLDVLSNAAGTVGLQVKLASTPTANAIEVRSSADALLAGFNSAGSVNVSSNPPATAASTGVTGTITWDSGFIYVCTATNTWKRVAIATW